MNNKFVVKNWRGEEETVYAHFELYSVNDWQGQPGYGVAIRFSDKANRKSMWGNPQK